MSTLPDKFQTTEVMRCSGCPYVNNEHNEGSTCDHPWRSLAVEVPMFGMPDDCPLRVQPMLVRLKDA